MESELYRKVYQIVMKIYSKTNLKRIRFTDADIVLTYLWAVLHDRPTNWACCKQNWPVYYRRRCLPDPSTMYRRLRTDGVQSLLKQIEAGLRDQVSPQLCRWIDAKPLPISGNSTDAQCGYGRAVGGKAQGYKLYAVAEAKRGFVAWAIEPMQVNEARVATGLIELLDQPGYLVGDTAYDSNRLYELAAGKAIQLVARKRMPQGSLGHRKYSPYRLRSIELGKRAFGKNLLKGRDQIERMFGQFTNFACGLKPLPNWVRTQFRVVNWIRAKMIFFQIWRQYVSPNPI
jgi:hypothetical protein